MSGGKHPTRLRLNTDAILLQIQLTTRCCTIEMLAAFMRTHQDNPQILYNTGVTLLRDAVKYKNSAIAHWLLDQGADPEITDYDGRPLSEAAERSDMPDVAEKIRQKLLERERQLFRWSAMREAWCIATARGIKAAHPEPGAAPAGAGAATPAL